MTAVVEGWAYWFGKGFPRWKLPPNWKLVESPYAWAVAVAPDGAEYVLAENEAVRWRKQGGSKYKHVDRTEVRKYRSYEEAKADRAKPRRVCCGVPLDMECRVDCVTRGGGN